MSSATPPGSPSDPDDPSSAEYLESGGGDRAARAERGGGSRKKAVAAGVGGAVALGLVGAGVWAATSFFATGDQPAQALPADTLGYLAVDLDPDGSQKIAALRTLNKFPAFKDAVGIGAEDDLRKKVFDLATEDSDCDLSFDDDVDSWLGSRFAVAAVDLGEEQPSPLVVTQVTDQDATEAGLDAIRECGGGSEDDTGVAFSGDWAVFAETQDLADQAVDAAGSGSLADDDAFNRWTEEAGDPGIMTGYASAAGAEWIADNYAELASSQAADPFATSSDDPFAAEDSLASPSGEESLPPEAEKALRDFEGAAMTMRFSDGSLELEVATDQSAASATGVLGDGDGVEAARALPADTAAVLGLSFQEGWGRQAMDYLEQSLPADAGFSDGVAQVEAQTGLAIPEDVETLLGSSAALSVGAGLDPQAFSASSDLSALPVAMKVQGDADEIDTVLDKLRALDPSAEMILGSDSEGDFVAIGPSNEYREQVLSDTSLGDSASYGGVIEEADRASVVLYVNFDAGGGWLEKLAAGDQQVQENLAPLDAVGISGWTEDEVTHTVVKVTTD